MWQSAINIKKKPKERTLTVYTVIEKQHLYVNNIHKADNTNSERQTIACVHLHPWRE